MTQDRHIYLINFHFGFKSGVWFFIAPVPVHCFSFTLTQENREACTEIQRRRYDELSWKMCINSRLCGGKSAGNDKVDYFSLGECHHNARAHGDQMTTR